MPIVGHKDLAKNLPRADCRRQRRHGDRRGNGVSRRRARSTSLHARLPIMRSQQVRRRPRIARAHDDRNDAGHCGGAWELALGNADEFRGVYDIQQQTLHLYEKEAQGQYRAPVDISAIDDPEAKAVIGENVYAHFRESLDVMRSAGTQFDVEEYLAGLQTPVFFGSALTNFGLEPFLQALVELAPPPSPRPSDSGVVNPTDDRFTGFVFKIQANMDPRHRDRIAFVRVCSGRFEKDMVLSNSRVGKQLRASRAYRFFGRDRETIDVAYAGDILGLVNTGTVRHRRYGATGEPLKFLGVPRFPAEHSAACS